MPRSTSAIRARFKGNQGTKTEPCWNCKRTAKLVVNGMYNIFGFVETFPGNLDFQPVHLDIEFKEQKY